MAPVNKSLTKLDKSAQRNQMEKSKYSSTLKAKKKKNYMTVVINNKEVRFNESMLKSIRRLQQCTTDMIPKLPFSKIVREITQQYGEFMWTSQAIAGLQASAELYLTQLFEDSTKCAYHAKRVMVKPNDMHLVLDLRSHYDPVGRPC